MSHNKLYYNGITLEQKADSVELTPHFFHDLWGDGVSRCPICHAPSEWNAKRVVALLLAQELNFNAQVLFKWPCCQGETRLYVAVHKTNAVDDLALHISVKPIPADWWQQVGP